jgi:hypothetical protein
VSSGIEDDAPTSESYIVGIDPGEVNMGIAAVGETSGKLKFATLHSLRKTNEKVTQPELLDRLKNFINEDPYGIFSKATTIAVEDQVTERARVARSGFLNKMNNTALQNGLQALIGSKCKIVQPAALKMRYAKYFPKEEGLNEEQQRRLNKKNAVVSGRKVLSTSELGVIDVSLKSKLDDVFDSIWIAKYAREALVLGLPTVKERKKKEKKKGNGRKKRKTDE